MKNIGMDIKTLTSFLIFDSKMELIYKENGFANFIKCINFEDIKTQAIESIKEKIQRFKIEGKIFLIDKILIKSSTYYMIIVVDELQIKSIESCLKIVERENEFYKMVLDNYPEGITVTDQKTRILYMNDAVERISGIKKETFFKHSHLETLEMGLVPNSCAVNVMRSKKPASTINKWSDNEIGYVTGVPIFNEDNELKYIVAATREAKKIVTMMEMIHNTPTLSIIHEEHLHKISKVKETDFENGEINKIYNLLHCIADYDTSVLITGETGTGKDYMANYLHKISERKNGPYIKINCSAIPDNLLESELFGYEEGAFTGANKGGKKGIFELADKGTLFLDEIGEMSYHLQAKLLNVLQDKEIMRVGGYSPIKVDVRIITATNADLEALIKEKKFRTDLFYRINTISFKVPPLRERKDDIFNLVNTFADEFNKKYGKACSITPQAFRFIASYSWPGNIRELKSVIERVMILSQEDRITENMFKEHMNVIGDKIKFDNIEIPLVQAVENYERRYIEQVLKDSENLKEAAERLKVDISTLTRKKKKYGL